MLPDTNILYSDLADVIRKLDISTLTDDDTYMLDHSSEDCFFGLCHGLHFQGKAFVSLADSNQLQFSPETLCQLGHSLMTTALLLPALLRLQKSAERKILDTDTDES